MKTIYIAYYLFLASFLIVGCSSATDPDTPNEDVLGPKIGSTYSFNVYQLDGSGRQGTTVVNRGSFSVTSSNESYRGEDGLVTLLHSEKNRILYLKYLSSGDLRIYYPQFSIPFGPAIGSAWVRFPFAGGSTGSETLVDSTYTTSSNTEERFVVERTATYLGTEEKTVKGTTYTTTKIEERLEQKLFADGEPDFAHISELTYWYSPDLQYFVQIDAYTYLGDPDDPPLWAASRDILVDFELK